MPLSQQNVTEHQPQWDIADQKTMGELIARVEGLELQLESVQSWLAADPLDVMMKIMSSAVSKPPVCVQCLNVRV